jgi:hypothetical protein
MATESRVVTFTNSEIIEALLHFCETTKRPVPEGGVRQFKFSNDQQVAVTLEPVTGTNVITFHESEIAAALILYCRKLGIPVARRAAKSLQVGVDTVALHLTLREASAPGATTAAAGAKASPR